MTIARVFPPSDGSNNPQEVTYTVNGVSVTETYKGTVGAPLAVSQYAAFELTAKYNWTTTLNAIDDTIVDSKLNPYNIEYVGLTPRTVANGGAAMAKYAQGYLPEMGSSNFFFCSEHFRTPSIAGNVGANNYRIDVNEFWSASWVSNGFRFAYGSSRADAGGIVTQSELLIGNVINFEGAELWAFLNSSWVKIGDLTVNGSATWTIDPATNPVGVLTDELVYLSGNIPAKTQMQVRTATNVPVNGDMYACYAPSQAAGRIEWSIWGTTTQVGQLGVATKPTGSAGSISGAIYCPSYCVARPVTGLDRPVVWANGDSIGYGRNSLSTYNNQARIVEGFMGLGLDDDTSSKRMTVYNMSVSGLGPGYAAQVNSGQAWRECWKYRLDLMRLVPNRPYTHMVTQMCNNSGLDAAWRLNFGQYYDLMLSESTFWGDAPAPLYQARPIPRVGTPAANKGWCATLADQQDVPANNQDDPDSFKWAGFDNDLQNGWFPQLSGVINTWAVFSYDRTVNKMRIKIPANIPGLTTGYTLAANFTSGTNSCSVVELPVIGDMIVFNKGTSGGGAYVRSYTGSGPYTVFMPGNVTATGLLAGAVLPTTLAGDNIGLHPATRGHEVISAAVIAWKNQIFP